MRNPGCGFAVHWPVKPNIGGEWRILCRISGSDLQDQKQLILPPGPLGKLLQGAEEKGDGYSKQGPGLARSAPSQESES